MLNHILIEYHQKRMDSLFSKNKHKSKCIRTLTSMTRKTLCCDSLQSRSATTFSWCSSVSSFKILISFPRRFCDLAKLFLVILLMATGKFVFCEYKRRKKKRVSMCRHVSTLNSRWVISPNHKFHHVFLLHAPI